jgi:hypothetical protein
MLTSILSNATAFGDDVFSEDGPTNALESYVGELTGMENAVFVLSGTMGNQIALRCLLTQPPYVVICDRRSHIFEFECGMASIFSHARMIPVMPDFENQTYLTRGDIIPNIVPDDGDAHGAPTKVITLENTFWGKVMLVEEVRRISNYARDRGIKVHMDGARLWNAFSPPPPPLPHLLCLRLGRSCTYQDLPKENPEESASKYSRTASTRRRGSFIALGSSDVNDSLRGAQVHDPYEQDPVFTMAPGSHSSNGSYGSMELNPYLGLPHPPVKFPKAEWTAPLSFDCDICGRSVVVGKRRE